MLSQEKNEPQTDKQAAKAGKVKRARRGSLVVLLLILGGVVWFGGNYYIVRTDNGMDLVKKDRFSMISVMVSLDAIRHMAPAVVQQRFPELMPMLQTAQNSVGNVADSAKVAADTTVEAAKMGADAVKSSVR